jgi:primase-polymerase (primpol)-like protein
VSAPLPTYLEPIPDAIPEELRRLPWVLWRAEPRPGDKPAKVPYRIADPSQRASSTDATTWGMFADAAEAYGALGDRPAHPVRGPIAGIGVVLARDAGITCIDLDRVLDGGARLDAPAKIIVGQCDSWTEISPSGTGLHVFVRGTVSQALKGDRIEVYAGERYICITGHRWPGTPSALRWQQHYLEHLVRLETESRPPSRA